jgi:hypothetical protein
MNRRVLGETASARRPFARAAVLRARALAACVPALSVRAECPHVPKIGDLHLTVSCEHQIGGLDVAVDHAARVTVVERFEQLLEEAVAEAEGQPPAQRAPMANGLVRIRRPAIGRTRRGQR